MAEPENEEPEVAREEEPARGKRATSSNPDYENLRHTFDGSDQFMRGHQTKKIRTQRLFETPAWALDDAEIKNILLRAFPKLETNANHRKRAGRWLRVITLYYKLRMPHNQVAKEIGVDYHALISLIRNIKRSANGRRADGSGQLNAIHQTTHVS